MNAWDKQTGVKGRLVVSAVQSAASVRRILAAVPKQTLRLDSCAIGPWQATIPATHARRNTAKCGTVTLRRKARKRQ